MTNSWSSITRGLQITVEVPGREISKWYPLWGIWQILICSSLFCGKSVLILKNRPLYALHLLNETCWANDMYCTTRTCYIVKIPKFHLNMVPFHKATSSNERLGKHHVLVTAECKRLHWNGLELERLQQGEICDESGVNVAIPMLDLTKNNISNDKLTSCYAIKRLWSKIVDFLPLIGCRAVAVYLVHGCVRVVNPVHQPLQFAITGEQISTQVTGQHTTVKGLIVGSPNNLHVYSIAACLMNTYTFVSVSTPLKRSFGRDSRLLKARLLWGNFSKTNFTQEGLFTYFSSYVWLKFELEIKRILYTIKSTWIWSVVHSDSENAFYVYRIITALLLYR